MRYPVFYDMFRDGIKNTWTVEEVDFSTDLVDLRSRLTPAEIHLIQRLVAFFATGDSIVSNNLVLNLYKHINSPEARLYLSRQLFEEAVHVQFYLTLLDNYVPDPDERAAAFAAVENIPSISKKADFCMKWMDSIQEIDQLTTRGVDLIIQNGVPLPILLGLDGHVDVGAGGRQRPDLQPPALRGLLWAARHNG